ncbi:hypothetical protein JTE90_017872 [Oedothorax gibbosus]|uniref:Hypervirulence associated protein TUDOR domain-containing protein n=1 Tax=Oedothorax gibbosus TaxID=931172 RepID=A0AAV6V426_9ARAC|nr:hypothetical protein JTE90_017872 [Oedothorax gibbosus]
MNEQHDPWVTIGQVVPVGEEKHMAFTVTGPITADQGKRVQLVDKTKTGHHSSDPQGASAHSGPLEQGATSQPGQLEQGATSQSGPLEQGATAQHRSVDQAATVDYRQLDQATTVDHRPVEQVATFAASSQESVDRIDQKLPEKSIQPPKEK